MPHIAVSQLPNIGIPEDSTHEFKTSIFIAPGTQVPGAKQMTEIAKSLAAFMNADGGELYTRCTGCYAAKFGIASAVRAKEVANKAYFYNPNYVIHKLLAHFGIDVERVMIRAS